MTYEKTKGDENRDFESLYLEQLPALLRTARRMTFSEQDAEDLVQEAVSKAFRAFDRFEKGSHFKAWIFKIMTNTHINNIRKHKNQPAQAGVEVLEEVLEAPQDMMFAFDDLGDHLHDEVKQALDSLSEDFRQVLLLNSVEGFSYKEIADILEIPIGTVMSRLYRARRDMKSKLGHTRQSAEGSASHGT